MVLAIWHHVGGGSFCCIYCARRKPDRRRQHRDRQADKNGKKGPADAIDHAFFRRKTKTVQLWVIMAAMGASGFDVNQILPDGNVGSWHLTDKSVLPVFVRLPTIGSVFVGALILNAMAY